MSVFLAPNFLARNADIMLVSSSSVSAQKTSIFSIFSLRSNSSSDPSPLSTMALLRSFESISHLSSDVSSTFTLYLFSRDEAKEEPIMPPPTIMILDESTV